MGYFLLALIERFSVALTLRCYEHLLIAPQRNYATKLRCLKGGGSQISGGRVVVHQRLLASEN